MKKQINTRKDAVTKDMQADTSVRVQTWHIPHVGNVEAESYSEALAKAKTIIKKNKG